MPSFRAWWFPALFAVSGCLACAASTAEMPSPSSGAGGPGALFVGAPLLVDRSDLGVGTTVQFNRIPNASELNDLFQVWALRHVVLTLSEWPAGFEQIESLAQVPLDRDIVVVLPGYPPNRQAAQAWDALGPGLRVIIVVSGPPPSPGIIDDLNTMRKLERVVVNVQTPDRLPFDRLQRPLSFRVVMP